MKSRRQIFVNPSMQGARVVLSLRLGGRKVAPRGEKLTTMFESLTRKLSDLVVAMGYPWFALYGVGETLGFQRSSRRRKGALLVLLNRRSYRVGVAPRGQGLRATAELGLMQLGEEIFVRAQQSASARARAPTRRSSLPVVCRRL